MSTREARWFTAEDMATAGAATEEEATTAATGAEATTATRPTGPTGGAATVTEEERETATGEEDGAGLKHLEQRGRDRKRKEMIGWQGG